MHSKRDIDTRGKVDGHLAPTGTSTRRTVLAAGAVTLSSAALAPVALAQSLLGAGASGLRFQRIPTQFIAALGAPDATSGDNAQLWGLWRQDPGPRGVRLDRYGQLKAAGGIAPAQWKFDPTGWWMEEHGLIMESPEFPLPAGKYMVTGNRAAKAVLTIAPPGADGKAHWMLDGGATLHDVTHLACRSAIYTPAAGAGSCTPAQARISDFPVSPGAEMPPVASCAKQDYAVLIVLGIAVEDR